MSIEIEALKLQGTNMSKINTSSRPTSCARQRTRVCAIPCGFGTIDLVKKCRDAVLVTDDLSAYSVEDGFCFSEYGLSVHRDTIERRLPETLTNE
jgi:hypothetical protein